MKKWLAGSLFVIWISLFGCIVFNSKEVTAKDEKGININHAEQAQKLTLVEAISKTIIFHNDSIRGTSDNDFPPDLSPGQIVSYERRIGGPSGHKTRVNKSIQAKIEGGHYIVTLIKNYNVAVNGIEAKSIWKYDVSAEGVKMVDKKDDGNLITRIK